jgi:hypothetical protein
VPLVPELGGEGHEGPGQRLAEGARVAHDPDIGREVAADHARIGVHLHQPGAAGDDGVAEERGVEPEPGADADDAVGIGHQLLGQGGPPRPHLADEQLGPVVHGVPVTGSGQDRGPDGVRQGGRLGAGVGPHHAAPDDQDRPRRPGHDRCRPGYTGLVDGAGERVGASGPAGAAGLDGLGQDVAWHVDVDGPPGLPLRQAAGVVHQLGDAIGGGHLEDGLGHRLQHPDLVDLLEGIATGVVA